MGSGATVVTLCWDYPVGDGLSVETECRVRRIRQNEHARVSELLGRGRDGARMRKRKRF